MAQGSTGFLLKEGFRNFKENKLLSFASVGVLTACMLLIGIAVLISINLSSMMGYIQSLNQAVVFLEDNITEEQINSIKDSLEKNPNISFVEYVSKEKALEMHIATLQNEAEKEIFKELLGEENPLPALFNIRISDLTMLTETVNAIDNTEGTLQNEAEKEIFKELLGEENPLPALFNIRISDLTMLTETVNAIDNTEGVDYTKASTDIAETLIDIRTAVNFSGSVITGILVLVSIIIISNTIKVTIFNRRREINVMKFVGASDLFIRVPFFVEGILIGLVSGIMSFALTWGAYSYAFDWIANSKSSWFRIVSRNLVEFSDVAIQFGAGFLIFGVGFGFFGSLFFVNKYLRV